MLRILESVNIPLDTTNKPENKNTKLLKRTKNKLSNSKKLLYEYKIASKYLKVNQKNITPTIMGLVYIQLAKATKKYGKNVPEDCKLVNYYRNAETADDSYVKHKLTLVNHKLMIENRNLSALTKSDYEILHIPYKTLKDKQDRINHRHHITLDLTIGLFFSFALALLLACFEILVPFTMILTPLFGGLFLATFLYGMSFKYIVDRDYADIQDFQSFIIVTANDIRQHIDSLHTRISELKGHKTSKSKERLLTIKKNGTDWNSIAKSVKTSSKQKEASTQHA